MINCILCNYLWLQYPSLTPEENQKILLAVSILVCTEKSVRTVDYLFNIMITGKEFFNAITHYLKLCHTA